LRTILMCGNLTRAGLQTVVRDLALGMLGRGESVGVVSIDGGDLARDMDDEGVETIILSSGIPRFLPRFLASFFMVIRLSRLLKGRGVQVLNIHGPGPERIGLLAARLAGTPVKTFVFHSNYPVFGPGEGRATSVRDTLRRDLMRFDRCIAVSQKVGEWAVANGMVDAGKVTVIPNGVDLQKTVCPSSRGQCRRELGFDDKEILLVQVGRFEPPKNQEVSIRALPLVRREVPGARLLLVGEGPRVGQARETAAALGVFGSVTFLGVRRDVPRILKAADLFLLPSSWEGMPVSLLEAMANGLPVIGSDVPGIADLLALVPGAGALVPPLDEKALAGAVIRALDDPRWREDAGRRGARFVRDHLGLEQMVARYLSFHADRPNDG
jgi:glycosyltransferase involved in cell wall biosynthesis